MGHKILKYGGIAGMVLGVATAVSTCGHAAYSCAGAGNEAKRTSISQHGSDTNNIPLDERLGWVTGGTRAMEKNILYSLFGFLAGASFIGAGIYSFEKFYKDKPKNG